MNICAKFKEVSSTATGVLFLQKRGEQTTWRLDAGHGSHLFMSYLNVRIIFVLLHSKESSAKLKSVWRQRIVTAALCFWASLGWISWSQAADEFDPICMSNMSRVDAYLIMWCILNRTGTENWHCVVYVVSLCMCVSVSCFILSHIYFVLPYSTN